MNQEFHFGCYEFNILYPLTESEEIKEFQLKSEVESKSFEEEENIN